MGALQRASIVRYNIGMMNAALRWLCCALLGTGALGALLLTVYGNALPLRLGMLDPQLFALFELRWGWFALGVALFALLFRLTPAGKAGWTVGLTLLLGGGALAAIIGANWIPGQYGPAPPAPHLVDPSQVGVRDDEWVLGVTFAGQAQAYRWSDIQRRYVINDVIGDQPLVVMYCISCNSSLAYLAQQAEQTLRFGVVGVYRFETILHDELTGSWWREDGAAIAGPLEGAKLQQLEAALIPWADWKALYPHTQVSISN